jgi:HD-like signal output (HDOD) protein
MSSAADIGRVIADDRGLTARLLRLVNSPIYGFPARIDTVSQAISILVT